MTRTEQVHRTETHLINRGDVRMASEPDEVITAEVARTMRDLLVACEYEDLATLTIKVRDSRLRADGLEITAAVKDTIVIYDVFEQLEIARLDIIAKAQRDANRIIRDIDSGEYERRIRKDALLAGMIADLERLDGKLQVMIGGVWMDVAKAVAAASVAFRSMAESLQSG